MNARRAAAVVAVAAAFRLLLAAPGLSDPRGFLSKFYDAPHYVAIAENLAAGRGFTADTLEPREPNVFRAPLFPALVALPASFGEAARGAVALNVLASCLTALLLMALGTRLWGERVGFVAAVAFALEPTSALYSAMVFTEAVFTLLFLAFVGALLLYRERPRTLTAAGAGLLLGLGVLTRPVGLMAVPLLLYPLALARRTGWPKAAARSLLSLAVVAAVVSPWVWRNYRATGTPVLTTVAGVNLLLFGAAKTRVAATGEDFGTARRALVGELVRRGYDADSSDPRSVCNRADLAAPSAVVALSTFRAHPLAFARVLVVSALQMAFGMPTAALYDLVMRAHEPSWEGDISRFAVWPWWLKASVVLWLAYTAALYLFAAASPDAGGRRRLLVVPFALLLLPPLLDGHSRLRVPAMPFVCLLAAATLVKRVFGALSKHAL